MQDPRARELLEQFFFAGWRHTLYGMLGAEKFAGVQAKRRRSRQRRLSLRPLALLRQ